MRSEEHTSELQSRRDLVCRLLLEKKKKDALLQARTQINEHIATTNQVQTGERQFPLHIVTIKDTVLAQLRVDSFFFFFNDTATTEIYTLSLHDALPILIDWILPLHVVQRLEQIHFAGRSEEHTSELQSRRDLVCRLLLEKKKKNENDTTERYKPRRHTRNRRRPRTP